MSARLFFSLVLLIVGCTTPVSAYSAENAELVIPSSEVAAEELVERRVLTRGDELYDAMRLLLSSAQIAEQLVLEVRYPSGLDWRSEAIRAPRSAIDDWAARSARSHKSAKSFDLPVPEPPSTRPPLGTRYVETTSCADVRTSSSSSFAADVTYTFEYRFTRDTDGDKKPDADPQWVLVDVKMTPLFSEGQPHIC